MRTRVALPWLSFWTLATSACALTGYDFSDYQPVATPAAGAPAGGEPPISVERSGPIATTFGIGGDPEAGSPSGAGGATGKGSGPGGAANRNEAGEAGKTASCEPVPCATLGVECGLADNGCGAPQNCGACFWWFQECLQNRCEIAE
jgi:hypothetical protein